MSRHTYIRRFALGAVALAAACDEPPPTSAGVSPSPSDRAPSLAVSEAAATTRTVVPTGEGLGLYPGLIVSPLRTRYRAEYHTNGYVHTKTMNVYVIWYGNWKKGDGSEDPAVRLLSEMTATLGNSPYFRINTLYPDVSGSAPTGGIVYSGAVFDSMYSLGAALSKVDVRDVVRAQVLGGRLPLDEHGIYVVMTSGNVSVEGFAQRYCAYHDVAEIVGARVGVVLVGSPARAPSVCQPQAIGPNGDAAADASASLLVAELSNTIVDLVYNAWYDRLGLEPADKCAWTYGTTYRAPNGALANMKIGGRDFLMQQLWVPTKNGGMCALSLPAP